MLSGKYGMPREQAIEMNRQMEERAAGAGAARETLTSGAFAAEVDADQREARELGATGVPFFVLDRRYGISGAQPTETFAQALDRAWADTHPNLTAGESPT